MHNLRARGSPRDLHDVPDDTDDGHPLRGRAVWRVCPPQCVYTRELLRSAQARLRWQRDGMRGLFRGLTPWLRHIPSNDLCMS